MAGKKKLGWKNKAILAFMLTTASTFTWSSIQNDALSSGVQNNLLEPEAAIHEVDKSKRAVFILTGGAGRVEAGVELGEYLGVPIFISGCNPDSVDTLTEKYQDVQTDLILGCKAQDTFGNAAEIREWLELNPHIRDVTVVTSDYHAKRSLQALEREIDTDQYNIEFYLVENPDRTLSQEFEINVSEYLKVSMLGVPILGRWQHSAEIDEYTKGKDNMTDAYIPAPWRKFQY